MKFYFCQAVLGIPMIASDIGSIDEKIQDGVNGRLFAPGDVNALRDIFTELIMAPETLVEWSRNIEPVNSIYDHIRALEEIYTGALNTV
jgi:glycosyltransferase involved in cell wall biosynthesis